jgi:hypothetical protein
MGSFNVGNNGSDIICRNNSLLISDNCYYDTEWNVDVPQGVIKTNTNDRKDGALCYILNGSRKENNMVWHQNLGIDPFPVPDSGHNSVYLWMDGTYHNDEEDKIAEIKDQNTKNQNEDNAIFDLNGRKLNYTPSILNSQLKRGVYIHNGKKIVKY